VHRESGRPLVFTVDEAAQLLKVSTSAIRSIVRAGKLPRIEGLGSSVRIPSHALYETAGEPMPPLEPLPLAPEVIEPRGHPDRPAVPPATRVAQDVTRTSAWRARPTTPKKHQATIRIGDRRLWLLSDSALDRVMTWHIGDERALCGRDPKGAWNKSHERWPRATMCAACLSAAARSAGVALDTLPISRLVMMRELRRCEGVAVRKAGWHLGDGRRTDCGKSDGPWHLTERQPRTPQCFECREINIWRLEKQPGTLDHERRGLARWAILLDCDLDPASIVSLAQRAPGHVLVRQSREALTEASVQLWTGAARDTFARAETLSAGTASPHMIEAHLMVTANTQLLGGESAWVKSPPAAVEWLTPIIETELKVRTLRARLERASRSGSPGPRGAGSQKLELPS
jgi:excisionase family DNA binding protein